MDLDFRDLGKGLEVRILLLEHGRDLESQNFVIRTRKLSLDHISNESWVDKGLQRLSEPSTERCRLKH